MNPFPTRFKSIPEGNTTIFNFTFLIFNSHGLCVKLEFEYSETITKPSIGYAGGWFCFIL